MTAQLEIQQSAELFGWGHNQSHVGDTFVRGNRYVNVDYTRDGVVQTAQLRSFASLGGDHPLIAETGRHHKKELVLAWLAE